MDNFTIDARDIWCWSSGEFTFTLAPQQRQKILDAIKKWFVEWLIDGKKQNLTFDFDPSWDRSGITISSIISGQDREDMLTGTLEVWMDELTGDEMPTFESGHGKHHQNYENVILEYIEEKLWGIFSEQFPDWDDEDYQDVVEEWIWVRSEMGWTLLDQAKKISAFESYQTFGQEVREEKAASERQRIIRAGLVKRSRSFFEKQVQSGWPEGKIEKPTWERYQLSKKLNLALGKADTKELLAIQAVGLQISFVSNRVSSKIKKIVAEFLEKTPLDEQEIDEEELFVEGQRSTRSLPVEIVEIERHNELLMVESEGGPHIERVELLVDDILLIPGIRIVTVAYGGSSMTKAFDIDSNNSIGYHEEHGRVFTGVLLTAFDTVGSVIVRQFFEGRTKIYGVAIEDGKYHWLPAGEVKQTFGFDAVTGKPLPHEDGVEYCTFRRGSKTPGNS